MISLSIPKKTEKELIIFFKKNNLNLVVNEYLKNKKNLHHGKFIKKTNKPYPPILDDLYKIFYIVTKFKRITCLEFGTGWSTLVIAKALSENKKKYEKKINKLRFSKPFESFSVDNLKKYLKISKSRIDKNMGIKVNFFLSKNRMSSWNGQICNEYLKLPSVNPDFIYLDAPDHLYIDGATNGLKISNNDFMPMSSDILKIENFLTPGTIILVDGRNSNVNFLKNNFKRNWIVSRDKKRDHTVLILNDEPIGKLNKEQIKFYFNKI